MQTQENNNQSTETVAVDCFIHCDLVNWVYLGDHYLTDSLETIHISELYHVTEKATGFTCCM